MKERYKAIDGLKVFVTITIFLSHLNVILNTTDLGRTLYPFISCGAYGVNFFFVVSGFMMYLHYFDKFSTLNKEDYCFYVRRKISKLYPMYAITMSVFILLEMRDMFINGIFTQEYITDFIFRILISLPMLQSLSVKYEINLVFNSTAWFLSCLMIIYLVIPFIFWILQKRKNKKNANGFLLFIVSFGICAFFNQLWKKNPQMTGLFYCTPYIRFFHFFLGVSVGMILKNMKLSMMPPIFFNILEMLLIIVNMYAWIIHRLGGGAKRNYAVASGISDDLYFCT